MKKVKIVIAENFRDYEDEYSRVIIRSGITDWEEVSDENYLFLKNNMHRIVKLNEYDSRPILLVQDEEPVAMRIENLQKAVAKEKAQIEKEQKERAAKKNERMQKKLLKESASKRELFEKLKVELGVK